MSKVVFIVDNKAIASILTAVSIVVASNISIVLYFTNNLGPLHFTNNLGLLYSTNNLGLLYSSNNFRVQRSINNLEL